MRNSPVDDLAERAVLEEAALEAAREAELDFLDNAGSRPTYAAMSAKAKHYYMAGHFDNAVSFWKASLVLLGEVCCTCIFHF